MQDNTVTVSDVINDDSKNLKTIFDSNPITNNDDNFEINLEMGNCQYFTETEFKEFGQNQFLFFFGGGVFFFPAFCVFFLYFFFL